jgi:hypothetical protein
MVYRFPDRSVPERQRLMAMRPMALQQEQHAKDQLQALIFRRATEQHFGRQRPENRRRQGQQRQRDGDIELAVGRGCSACPRPRPLGQG